MKDSSRVNQGSCVNYLIRFPPPRPGCDVIDVYRHLDLRRDGAGSRFRSWKRVISGGMGQFWRTSFEKGWFQGHRARPATKYSTRNTTISGEMFHGPIGNAPCGTWRAAGRVSRSGGLGDGFHGPAMLRAAHMPYKAQDFRRRQVCHTRVQGFASAGQLSNSVQSNVKTGKFSPYRTYSVSPWVPERLPPPLDSARNEIGQCATGDGGRCWTVPATKSGNLSIQSGPGRAGWLAGAERRCPAGLGRWRGSLRR